MSLNFYLYSYTQVFSILLRLIVMSLFRYLPISYDFTSQFFNKSFSNQLYFFYYCPLECIYLESKYIYLNLAVNYHDSWSTRKLLRKTQPCLKLSNLYAGHVSPFNIAEATPFQKHSGLKYLQFCAKTKIYFDSFDTVVE